MSALSLSIPGLDPAEFAGSLEHAFGIITRSGFHCAPGAHAAIHTLHEGGTVRVSPGPNTTVAEIETPAQAILQLARALKR